MNGFDKRKLLLKKKIKQSAFELFRVHGIQNVLVTDIARHANVSKVSIYNYFGSKMNLVKEIMFDFMDNAYVELEEFISQDISFDDKFKHFMKLSYDKTSELRDGDSDGLINNELIQSPEVQNYLLEYSETKIKPLFKKLIKQGQEEGSVDESIEIETIFLYLQTMQGLLSTDITIKQRLDLGKLIYYGLRGKWK